MKKSLPWLILIIGIFFSTIIWSHITFPYDQSNTIIGEYSAKKINPLNDTFRGIFFIFFPLLLYFIVLLKTDKQRFNIGILKNNYHYQPTKKNINLLFSFLIIFCFLEFLILDYKNFLNNFDSHHEGTFLSAQLNLKSKNNFWVGTFYDYGFLGNNIGIFFNYFFGDYTIGIQRFSFKFLILINKILLLFICRKITLSIKFTKNIEIFFLVFSLSTLSLTSLYDHIIPFHPRVFLYLIFALIVFNIISSTKNNLFIYFLTGSFSLISLLFYWDIGTYVNFLILVLLIYLLIFKRHKEFFKIIFGITSAWVIFYIFIPSSEFREFINQYIIILNVSDHLLGLEFPKPFADKSTRYTKALLLIIFSGVFVINFIFNRSNDESHNIKFFLLFIFISAIVFFKSGLSRSDTPHIKYTSGLYTLLIFFFISYHIINFINKFKISDKVSNFFNKKLYSSILAILICFLFFFQNSYSNFLNIFKPDRYFYKITKIEDKEFLDNNYYEFIKIFKELTKNEICIQQFTDDNAIAYLVNKHTCTKYYVNGHIIKNWTENNFINELKISEPNYIVYSSEINWFKSRNNAPNADRFIRDNYFLFKDLSPWIIYKKRD